MVDFYKYYRFERVHRRTTFARSYSGFFRTGKTFAILPVEVQQICRRVHDKNRFKVVCRLTSFVLVKLSRKCSVPMLVNLKCVHTTHLSALKSCLPRKYFQS